MLMYESTWSIVLRHLVFLLAAGSNFIKRFTFSLLDCFISVAVTRMKKQWYSLKHSYIDYKRKRDSNDFAKKRKPNHYDALSFLDGDIYQNWNESITSEIQFDLDPIPTTSTSMRKKVTKPRVSPVQKNPVEKTLGNKKINTKYKLTNRKHINANEHFLFSLLPDMNKMDTRQLMNFKIAIMDAIRNITNENSAKVSQCTTKECESTSKDSDLPSKESDSTSTECELIWLKHECTAKGNVISNKTSDVLGKQVDYSRKVSGITRKEGDSTSEEGNLPVTSTRKPGPKQSKNTSAHCQPAPTMTRESIPSTSITSGGTSKATAGKGTFASRRLSLFLNSPDIWENEQKPSHGNQDHNRDSIQNNHQNFVDLDEETTML